MLAVRGAGERTVTPGSTTKAQQLLLLVKHERIQSVEAFAGVGKLRRLVVVTNKRRVTMGMKPLNGSTDGARASTEPVAVVQIPETQCVAGVCGRLDASSGGISSLHLITESRLKAAAPGLPDPMQSTTGGTATSMRDDDTTNRDTENQGAVEEDALRW